MPKSGGERLGIRRRTALQFQAQQTVKQCGVCEKCSTTNFGRKLSLGEYIDDNRRDLSTDNLNLNDKTEN